ncbi:MAG: proteasome regulatory particle base subunit [Sclerophora amabilis]|nr:MAG: proteasome regulatory particle base subunit [Sclerophora amabilis]
MVGLTSAAGLVGFLSEPDPELRVFALRTLNDEIDLLWTEIADSIGQIEALYEDESFPERELAALVTAKVYYHLQEYNESMVFALGAGKLFQLDHAGEFEDTIISKCVDTYIALSAMHNPATPASTTNQPPPQLTTAFPQSAEGGASTSASLTSPTTPFSQSTLPSKSLLSRQEASSTFDPSLPGGGNAGVVGAHPSPLALQRGIQKSLQAIIEQLFERCFREGRYRQVVGIAVEARNLDVLRRAILRASEDEAKLGETKQDSAISGKGEELMEYVLDICMTVVQERGLRNEILKLILDLLNEISTPDYFAIAKCVVYLNQHSLASGILRQLVEKGDPRSIATTYQIAFDLYDNGTQEFLANVRDDLPTIKVKATEGPENEQSERTKEEEDGETAKETDQLLSELNDRSGDPNSLIGSGEKEEPLLEVQRKTYESISNILRGTKSIDLNLEFLYRNNHTDISILNKVKDSLEARNSIFHTAVTFANAFMNSGTTSDVFFRQNLEWLGKAVNWSKFTATAALGVIHRGNLSQGQKLLDPYLPRDGVVAGSMYSQGGSLYALGLIYANHGTRVLEYLRDSFRKANDEIVQHGGALGLGVAGMATGSDEIYEELKAVLYADSALNGEAVGLSMGLVMLGTGNIKALGDMIQYAHDTQHEKSVRGLAMGMALIMFGRQEAADELINGLLDDPDPTLRYGGIMTLAMAYCGTGSNKAVRKLLHVAVSDVSDDVRRVAVMSLGFILFRKPSSVPRMVELLSESYNPHVRYGAAMALGISCAGTGLDEAIDLLEPMIKDPTDFVRQGALISLAMILIQQNEAMNSKVGSIRKTFQRIISDRHEDAMAKFGCALALGIIDAGGRNCTIGLQTQTGNLNMAGIVGMAVFTQYWYWFPLTHFLSLSFTPTSVIGLDQSLEIPSFKFHSATRPTLFDYPPEQEAKTDEAPEKVATAVLSTTAQAKRRAQKKEKLQRRESMDIDQAPPTPKISNTHPGDKMETDEDSTKDGEEKRDGESKEGKEGEKEENSSSETTKKKPEKEKEKIGYDLENMSRVLPAQLRFISFPEGRYEPVKKPTGGVVLLIDNQPSEPKTLLELKARKTVERAAAPETLDDRINAAYQARDAGAEGQGSGAAEAAGVLTAVDEDEDGGEEAELPAEFDYFSDDNAESEEIRGNGSTRRRRAFSSAFKSKNAVAGALQRKEPFGLGYFLANSFLDRAAEGTKRTILGDEEANADTKTSVSDDVGIVRKRFDDRRGAFSRDTGSDVSLPRSNTSSHHRIPKKELHPTATDEPTTLAPGVPVIPPDASSRLSTLSSSLPVHSLRRLMTTYLSLSKPRLTFLIVLTTTTAYSLYPVPALLLPATTASPSLSTLTLLFLTTGTALSSASANAFNMLIEPEFDAKMSRTRNRPLVRKLISSRGAKVFAVLTGTFGLGALYYGVNPTVAFLGGLNIFLYAGVYTPMKRLSVLNTWVGAIVGGIPPLMGWAAAAGQSASGSGGWQELLLGEGSAGGWLLAGLLFAWQFPHFNALSWTIREEYKAAGHKMLAWTNPRMNSRVALRYSFLFFPVCVGLWWVGVVDQGFLVTSSVANVWILKEAWRFWKKEGQKGTARGLFWASVWHLPVVMVLAMAHKKGLWEGVWQSIRGGVMEMEEVVWNDDEDAADEDET